MISPQWFIHIVFFSFCLPIFSLELTLADAENMAISHSFELHNMQQSMAITYFSHKLGIREYLPTVSFTYNDSRQVRYNSTDTDSLQLGLNLIQPIYNGGRSFLQRKLSFIQMSIQGAGLEKQTEEIMDQVWQIYYQLMIHQKKIELQKELLTLSKDQLDITLKKFELGSITEIDFIEPQIEVRSLEIEINSTQNIYLKLSSQFTQILGLDSKTELVLYPEIDSEYQGVPFDEKDKEYFYNTALEKNLELRSAHFEIDQAKAQYDIAVKSFLPKISLESSVNLTGEEFPLQRPTYSAKLNIEFPFKALPLTTSIAISTTGTDEYSRNQSYSAPFLQDISFILDKKSATIQVNQSLEKEQMLRQNLFFTIEQQILDLKQKRSTLELNRRVFDLQKQKLSILETKNRLGEVKELDLLKANIEYYNQEISIWEAILELVLSERTLEKTLGLGLGELRYLRNY